MLDFSLMADAPMAVWLAGALATFVVAVSKAGFGGAMGSLSLPIFLIVMPPGPALAVLLPVFLLCDFYVGWRYRKLAVRKIVAAMVIAACLGQLAGWLLFKQIDENMLLALIGALAVYTGGRYFWQLWRPTLSDAGPGRSAIRALRRRTPARAGLWCGLSGIASFISLTGGIPAQVFLLPLALPRALYVATMGWFFLLINLAKMPFYIELGLFDAASLSASLTLIPLVPLGVMLGIWANKAMSDTWFYHISHGFLLLLGARLMLVAVA